MTIKKYRRSSDDMRRCMWRSGQCGRLCSSTLLTTRCRPARRLACVDMSRSRGPHVFPLLLRSPRRRREDVEQLSRLNRLGFLDEIHAARSVNAPSLQRLSRRRTTERAVTFLPVGKSGRRPRDDVTCCMPPRGIVNHGRATNPRAPSMHTQYDLPPTVADSSSRVMICVPPTSATDLTMPTPGASQSSAIVLLVKAGLVKVSVV